MSLSNSPFHEVHRLKNWHIVLSLNYNYLALCSFVKLYAYLGNIIWIFFLSLFFRLFCSCWLKLCTVDTFITTTKLLLIFFMTAMIWYVLICCCLNLQRTSGKMQNLALKFHIWFWNLKSTLVQNLLKYKPDIQIANKYLIYIKISMISTLHQ